MFMQIYSEKIKRKREEKKINTDLHGLIACLYPQEQVKNIPLSKKKENLQHIHIVLTKILT